MSAREVVSIAGWVFLVTAIISLTGRLVLNIDGDVMNTVRIIGWTITAVILLVAGALYLNEKRT